MATMTDKDDTVDISVTDFREHYNGSDKEVAYSNGKEVAYGTGKEPAPQPQAVSDNSGHKNVFEV